MTEQTVTNRWVKLDERGALCEIDRVRLGKAGVALSKVLDQLDDDPLGLGKACAPYLKGAVNGDVVFPIDHSPLPILRMQDSGVVFPEGFIEAYSAFFVAAQGLLYDHETQQQREDGVWVWVTFEEGR